MNVRKVFLVIIIFIITTLSYSVKSDISPKKKSTSKTFDMKKLHNELEGKTEKIKKSAKSKKTYKASGSKEVVYVTLKMMLYITIISFLIYFVIKALKKNKLGLKNRLQGNNAIEVVESAFIGQNKNVSLVKVLDKVLVLGVTDSNINLLTTIENKEDIDKVNQLTAESASRVSGNFTDNVNSFLDKFKKEAPKTVGKVV